MRKGRPLSADDIEVLRRLGRATVWVARLEPGDVDEDGAAARIAAGLAGEGLALSAARTGRVNVRAERLGVLRVDIARLARLNACAGVTVATLRAHTAVPEGRLAATLKVPPYALSEATVAAAEAIVAGSAGVTDGPLLELTPLEPRRVGLILSGSPGARARLERTYPGALGPRLDALAASIESVDFVPLDGDGADSRLAEVIATRLDAGIELLILAGETAIQDRRDIAPRAIERAGGEVTVYGAPVDPGNLLLVGYRGAVPILGAPGCARSPKTNVVDLVLPRLLAGDRLQSADLAALGHGGLLEDIPDRPMPRRRVR